MLTPEPKRSALYAFYAWSRLADDLADGDQWLSERERARVRRRSKGTAGPDADGAVVTDSTARAQLLQAFWARTCEDARAVGARGDGSPLDVTSAGRAATPPGDLAAERHQSDPRLQFDPGESQLWPAFQDTIARYGISIDLLRPMCEGQIADLDRGALRTFAELERYCFEVAGSVGLTCVRIWGVHPQIPSHHTSRLEVRNRIYLERILPELVDPGRLDAMRAHRRNQPPNNLTADRMVETDAARRPDFDAGGHHGARIADLPPVVAQLAEWRGTAFQLTNILRDYAEDHDAGRVYIPLAFFDRFGLTPSELHLWSRPRSCEALVRHMLAIAHGYYVASAPLESLIDSTCVPTLTAMTRIYRGLMTRIELEPRVIALGPRPRLSRSQKLAIAFGSLINRRRMQRTMRRERQHALENDPSTIVITERDVASTPSRPRDRDRTDLAMLPPRPAALDDTQDAESALAPVVNVTSSAPASGATSGEAR